MILRCLFAFVVAFSAVAFCTGTYNDDYPFLPPSPHCFRSTYDIIVQQLVNPLDEYIVCPNSQIDIGVPSNKRLEAFVDGDWPLMALGPNVVIKCGQSGEASNNCVLNSPFLHIATFPNVRNLGVLFINTKNLHISGFTLTGRE